MSTPNRQPIGSLAQQRHPEFQKMYGLRKSNAVTIPLEGPPQNEEPYEESMNTNTIDDLSDMFNMLVLKPTITAYKPDEIDTACVLLNLNNTQFLQLTNPLDDQASPNINVKNLLHRLFILVIR